MASGAGDLVDRKVASLKQTGRSLLRALADIRETVKSLDSDDAPAEQAAVLQDLERRAANSTAAAAKRLGFSWAAATRAPAPHVESDSSSASSERTFCAQNAARKRHLQLARPSTQFKRYRVYLSHADPGFVCHDGPSCSECWGDLAAGPQTVYSPAPAEHFPSAPPHPTLSHAVLQKHALTHPPLTRNILDLHTDLH